MKTLIATRSYKGRTYTLHAEPLEGTRGGFKATATLLPENEPFTTVENDSDVAVEQAETAVKRHIDNKAARS